MTVPRPAPVQATGPVRQVGAARRLVVATLVAVLAGLWLGTASAGATPLAPTQDPGLTTTLVVPTTGATATSAPATTAPGAQAPTTAAPAADTGSSTADAENRKIWLVVGGLVAVAVALMLLTIRYWRHTKPVPVEELLPATSAPGRHAATGEHGRHSRRAVAGADHAAADDAWEPRGTGEHDRIEVPAASRTVRPTADQRAAAFRAAANAR